MILCIFLQQEGITKMEQPLKSLDFDIMKQI